MGHDAGAVAACAVSVHGATVGEIPQALESLLDNAVGRGLPKLGHEPHTTSVVFLSTVKSCATVDVVFAHHFIIPPIKRALSLIIRDTGRSVK